MESAKLSQCESCKKHFTTKDNRNQQHTHFPYILKCGHTVCEACIKNASKCKQKISCLQCQTETDLDDDYAQTLVPDIYALGIVSLAMRQKPNVKLKFIPVGSTNKDLRGENPSAVICDECSRTVAVWRCDKCAVNFCNFCFDKIHRRSKVMQKHESHPIQAEEYHSMVQGGCSEHLQRQIEFYCETDKELVCSHCVVMGKHKGHDVVTLMDKNESYIDELKTTMEEAHKVQRVFKFTEKRLCEIIPSSKMDVSHLVTEIKRHFHKVHSILQLREFELLSELQSLANHNTSSLENMCDELSHYRKELAAALKDAEELLSNRYISVSAIELVKKLQAFKEIPCHLVSVQLEETPDIRVKFNQDTLEKLKIYGNFETNIKTKYVLKSEKDLPPDYQIDVEEDTTTDTESLASCSALSDSQSDDLLSPLSNTDLSKQKNAFLKANMSTAHEEEVLVSHICHPANFWIQKLLDKRKLDSMQDTMNKWCNTSNNVKASAKSAQVGNLYLVQYSADAKWYRARLKAIMSCTDDKKISKINSVAQYNENEDFVEIHYIDYGNAEVIPVSRLKSIPPRFLHQPAFAVNCSLWDIMPATKDAWSKEAIKVFAKFVGNKALLMKIMEQRNDLLYIDLCQPPAIDIINDVPVSVRDALVFLDLANLINDSNKNKSSKCHSKRKYLPAEELCHEVVVNVVLSHVGSPDNFYVQKLGGGARYLSNLQFKLQDKYKNEPDFLHAVYTPAVGMVCASQYSLDKQWYRAEVIRVQNSNMVEVQYVDFGNNEFVPYWRLRKIPDEFLKLNKQAICCRLVAITPVNADGWDEKVNQWFTEVAGKKPLHIRTKSIIPGEKKASVVLYQVAGNVDICINAMMVKEGLAISTGPESAVIEFPHEMYLKAKNTPKVIFQPQKDPVPDKHGERNNPTTTVANSIYTGSISHPHKAPSKKLPYLPVHVVHVESPYCLYVHLATDEEQMKFEQMMKKMQHMYQQTEISGVQWKEMDICAALASQDSQWYRGRIAKEVDSEHFQVAMLDYGSSEVVHKNDLRILLDPFQEERIFSIKCKLAGVVPAGADNQWSFMACEFLQELVTKHEVFYFTKKGDSENDLQLVDLLYKEVQGGALEPTTLEYKSVVQLLIDKGLALPTRRLSQEKKSEINKDLSISGSNMEDICCKSKEKNSNANKEKKEAESVPNSCKDSLRVKTSGVRKSTMHWKPPTLPEDEDFTGIATHVGNDCCIYVTLSSSSSVLNLINEALQTKYTDPEMKSPDIPPAVGQACIAQFCLDNRWYRAQVISKKTDQIKVLFIDYGNLETVPLSKIRTDLILTEVPQQCLECELFDLLPAAKEGEWPIPVLDFIHSIIVEQTCHFKIEEPPHPGKRLQVTLILPNKINLSTVLIERGDAISPSMLDNKITSDIEDINSEILDEKELSKISENTSESTVLTISEEEEEDNLSTVQYFAEPNLPEVSVQFPLIITQLLEPNMVYIQQTLFTEAITQKAKDRNDEYYQFIAMMEELAESAETFDIVKDPKPGMTCCGMYSYDGKWYRCQIKKLSGNDAAVFYVDYGNSETISTDKLRYLPDKFLKFPVQAYLCKLCGIVPSGDAWSDQEANQIVSELLQKNYIFLGEIKKYGVPLELDLFIDGPLLEDGKPQHIAQLLKEKKILCKEE